jgi:hypothetical protein
MLTLNNAVRVHHGLGGIPPHHGAGHSDPKLARLDHHRWQSHCRDLYQLPVAA